MMLQEKEFKQNRSEIHAHILSDKELTDLYYHDACFKASIEIAIESAMPWNDAIILALKNGYKYKQEIFEQSVKIMQQSITPINLNI